jgi:hypothetical protein
MAQQAFVNLAPLAHIYKRPADGRYAGAASAAPSNPRASRSVKGADWADGIEQLETGYGSARTAAIRL